jgi:hypothetical protein
LRPGEVLRPVEARALGLTRKHLESSQFRGVVRGVHTLAETPQSFELVARACLALAPDAAALACFTALRLWGVQLPQRWFGETAMHIVVPPATPRPRRPWIRVHQGFGWTRVRVANGLRVVAPEDAWIQAAADGATLDELVEIGDGLVRRVDPLSTPCALREALGRWAGRPGVDRARQALALVRPGTGSIRETRLRLAIVRAGLPEPKVGLVIADDFGTFVAEPDLTIKEYKTIAEYDGAVHGGEARRRRDVRRRRTLEELGYRVLTATADDVATMDRFIAALRRVVAEQATRLGLEAPSIAAPDTGP